MKTTFIGPLARSTHTDGLHGRNAAHGCSPTFRQLVYLLKKSGRAWPRGRDRPRPGLLWETDIRRNSVLTATGNLLVGVPIGGQEGGFRPYVLGGLGVS
jgi:hypothetical protein